MPMVRKAVWPAAFDLGHELNATDRWKDEMDPIDLYLDLLSKALTRALFEENDEIVGIEDGTRGRTWKRRVGTTIAPYLRRSGYELTRKRPYDARTRENGEDWPARAESMAGLKRMANTRFCIETVLNDGVPGDIIETGVWRGGMAIFMRGVLAAHGVDDRTVWCADSFEGLPLMGDREYGVDHKSDYDFDTLAVSLERVRHNFERYGLLDDQVQFLKGWFKDTLPAAPIAELAVLRLDGDMYESTIQALDNLYPKLSPGGFCIIDDYNIIPACKEAVTDYRSKHGIDDEVIPIDNYSTFWRKAE